MDKYKTVQIRWTIDLPMKVPKEWDKHSIDFHFNESSWCCSNLIGLLEEYDEKHGCICNICSAKVIGVVDE